MTIDKKDDPSSTSAAYDAMLPSWERIETVLSGTDAMRAARTRYLPQYTNETAEAYQDRLVCSTLLNQSELTLNSWVGRPFSEPVRIGADVPEEIRGLFDDVDLQGNQISVFARNWFREGLSKAFAHVLIDYPKVDRTGRTLLDDSRDRLRPYWTFIRPENLIFASSGFLHGREVLTHVRIREQIITREGFGETVSTSIRVFDRDPLTGEVTVSLWQFRQDDKTWAQTQFPTVMDIDEIPIVTFYADRQGLMYGKPPLKDVVDLNIAHWQSSSDQRNILTVARFPILAVSGVDDDEAAGKKKLSVGPRKVLTTPEVGGKWYYVEHQGNAIAAGRLDCQDLEEKMAHYGAEFLQKRPGSTTATARALDTAESTSALQDAVLRFNDALNQAIVLTGKWVNIDQPGQVLINTEFCSLSSDQADYDALNKARASRDISRTTFLRELQRRGTLADDFNPEVDLEEIQAEESIGSPKDKKPIDPFAVPPLGGDL